MPNALSGQNRPLMAAAEALGYVAGRSRGLDKYRNQRLHERQQAAALVSPASTLKLDILGILASVFYEKPDVILDFSVAGLKAALRTLDPQSEAHPKYGGYRAIRNVFADGAPWPVKPRDGDVDHEDIRNAIKELRRMLHGFNEEVRRGDRQSDLCVTIETPPGAKGRYYCAITHRDRSSPYQNDSHLDSFWKQVTGEEGTAIVFGTDLDWLPQTEEHKGLYTGLAECRGVGWIAEQCGRLGRQFVTYGSRNWVDAEWLARRRSIIFLGSSTSNRCLEHLEYHSPWAVPREFVFAYKSRPVGPWETWLQDGKGAPVHVSNPDKKQDYDAGVISFFKDPHTERTVLILGGTAGSATLAAVNAVRNPFIITSIFDKLGAGTTKTLTSFEAKFKVKAHYFDAASPSELTIIHRERTRDLEGSASRRQV